MTRNKKAELIEEEKEEKKKEQVSTKDKNFWENMGLMFYYKANDMINEMKDVSLIEKSIHQDVEKLSVKEENKLKMKLQVMQTLTDATYERLGGSAKAIFQMNKGLIHVLTLINQAPDGKISTRELLNSINSTSMHKHLREAEELGFIRRSTERKPKGQKGGVMVMNSLTEEGHVLLKLHDELASSSVRESRQHR